MKFKDRKTQLLLIILAIAVALTSVALIKIVSEVILPTILPPPPRKLPPPILAEPPQDALSLVISSLYNNSPYLALSTWAAFLLTLYWKGAIRTFWRRKGYDYDIFKVISKMRGSSNRIKILQSLSMPKSRLQLANELGMDWKSIDGHIDILLKYNLVKEIVSIGTAKYLMTTERGKEMLKLLDNSAGEQT